MPSTERHSSPARPAEVSFKLPETDLAGRVRCSGWLGVTIRPVPERQQLLSDGRAARHRHGVLSGEAWVGLPAVLESMVAVACVRMFHGAIRLIRPSLTISV
jgi:hypothetical protein